MVRWSLPAPAVSLRRSGEKTGAPWRTVFRPRLRQ
ncbi:hypothetical protein AvCA_16750 [Azotobacter vinelandii CA]|uniref:Uncharacterized protein n=2 Tax=Azotobacter vinelandii TaxID=354 RepID=C1DSD3_AZOVD|nr:hypothetical protein Avin_16750 [Azotobacter vinelandii DJ]AGK15233.1 hypothetical protein AvCA_16750 [Azotobacter vinelandii CA]AGK20052.1 hypothetical protein AvCA6_16750 [Azotobacter vinelandii CA6]